MRTWDAIVVGGGIIGISIALALRRRGDRVLVVERGRPGGEATYAAAGMLAPWGGGHMAPALAKLGQASLGLYRDFVRALEEESGMCTDLRREGSIAFPTEADEGCGTTLSTTELAKIEPALSHIAPAFLMEDASVDPRALMAASLAAAERRGIEIICNAAVVEVVAAGAGLEVHTAKEKFSAACVVNSCGAWAREVRAEYVTHVPTRPVKGQMLSVAPSRPLLRHMVRAEDVYLVPRGDGRILIGATVEEAGFDKRVEASVIHRLHQSALRLIPELAQARVLESWAGLRPGTPDDLPILGPTSLRGYFLATGHFRNGILLAPVTALCLARMLHGEAAGFDLAAFSPRRFSQVRAH